MGGETTPAATGKVGVLRRDPMAMLPFCGYNMADYFGHWLEMGKRMSAPPKIFFINWYRRDETGRFLWPGFGENVRVLKWIIQRAIRSDAGGARETPVGWIPTREDLDLSGMAIPEENLPKLFAVDREEWKVELESARTFLAEFGDRMPREIWQEFHDLKKAVKRSG